MNTHSTLTLVDGTKIDIPYISESGAGWILKPDQARTEHDIQRGLNKSFGRSHEGREVSRKWRRDYLQTQFDRADWKALLSVDYDVVGMNTPGGDGITFSVLDPIYGWNVFRFVVSEPHYRDNDYKVNVTWEGTAIQQWYIDRQVDDQHPYAWRSLYTASYTFDHKDRGKIYKMAEEFAADPMGYVEQKTNAQLTWQFPDMPKLDWGTLKPVEHFLDDAQTFHLQVDKSHVFWRKGDQAKAVFVEATEQINMLELAFRHLGMNIRIGTGINWEIGPGERGYREDELRSVTFEIPADSNDQHNASGHQITLDLKGLTVRCGYVTDEKHWEHKQARQAADWLTEFEEDTTPEIEEYDHKPN